MADTLPFKPLFNKLIGESSIFGCSKRYDQVETQNPKKRDIICRIAEKTKRIAFTGSEGVEIIQTI